MESTVGFTIMRQLRLGRRRGFPCLGNQAQCSLHTRSLSMYSRQADGHARVRTRTLETTQTSIRALWREVAADHSSASSSASAACGCGNGCSDGSFAAPCRPAPRREVAADNSPASDLSPSTASTTAWPAPPQQPRPRLPGQAGMQTLWRSAWLTPSAGSLIPSFAWGFSSPCLSSVTPSVRRRRC